jgi:hypothetical protein
MNRIISRAEARASGLVRYFTGRRCKHGHVAEREVSSGSCLPCHRKAVKERRQRDPDKARARERACYQINRLVRRAYHREKQRIRSGLPTPTRPCPEVCEYCGENPGKKSLHLDHDHVTGAFRGWLCIKCNLAFGKFGDCIEGLQKAIAYLERASRDARAARETAPA